MKVLLYTDTHWSAYSSIIRKRGKKYSQRLENLIQSVSWAEKISEEQNCDAVAMLGDFFDKSDLCAEEITALNDVEWNKKIPHYFLVGNHEMASNDLVYSSAHLFNLENFKVIDSVESIDCGSSRIVFIPYILDGNRKSFSDYVGDSDKITFVLSHNDLQIQYGSYKSESGFTPNEIEKSCELFINGHLHNGGFVWSKIINLGNLTGQNFSEDAFKYNHCVAILDTNSLGYDFCEFIENPYAFNFYKITYDSKFSKKIKSLKDNAVVAVTVKESDYDTAKDILSNCKNVIESRFIVEREISIDNESDVSELSGDDHLQQFSTYILQTLGNSDIVLAELAEVCK